MNYTEPNYISELVEKHEATIRAEWIENLQSSLIRNDTSLQEQLKRHCTQFLSLLAQATKGNSNDIESAKWDEVRHLLAEISVSRAKQGSTPTETATFVFSLKEVLFKLIRTELAGNGEALASVTLSISQFLDNLGLYTVEVFQKSRDQIIARQQQELLELSTPVVKLWQNVLALPLIGTLDSARTQVVMENLLQKIVETGAAIAIIDITGVPTVDTLVAQHLMKTIAAARLMGADCIISGIRPQIAQTIVHLGVNLEDVVTKATLADAFMVALTRMGASITFAKHD
ncbi:STAS domain-containing protein [Undibacterium sp. TJN19]|uniref:STAS domain-containing protein n=1 Tax=Undibacterium sp. TJN19 TaxID=3413055 RepID=UPI003BEFFD1B